MLTAWMLRQSGHEVLLLEGREIGCGQTGRTTGKITSQHGLIYSRLLRSLGDDAAKCYAAAQQQAISDLHAIVQQEHIDCDWQTMPTCLYTRVNRGQLYKEYKAALLAGIPAEFEETSPIPGTVATLIFPGQACFHPLKFLYALAECIPLCEHTPVLAQKGRTLLTPGGSVTAKHVIYATHYPQKNLPGFYFTRLYQSRSHTLVLRGTPPLSALYYSPDPGAPSLRPIPEGMLFCDAGGRTGVQPQGRYAALRAEAERLFPACKETDSFSAQDCMTPDGMPYIGCYGLTSPYDYVITGFNKWGMTGSMIAASLLTDLLAGKTNSCADLFSSLRLGGAGIRTIMHQSAESAGGLARTLFAKGRRSAQSLRPGEGEIVCYKGKTYGGYRSEDRVLHLVSPTCTHLGCRLVFNADEASWDCPCHGSRFSYRGTRLDGPAKKNLAYLCIPADS